MAIGSGYAEKIFYCPARSCARQYKSLLGVNQQTRRCPRLEGYNVSHPAIKSDIRGERPGYGGFRSVLVEGQSRQPEADHLFSDISIVYRTLLRGSSGPSAPVTRA